jgi:uncharacterized repeat protein (TIGR02543 family)
VFDSTTPVTANITVYAQWTEIIPDTYTVTFDSQGGSAVSPITGVVSDNTVTLPANPTQSGYTFTGWNTASNGLGSVFDSTTPVTANITVYAQWTENPSTTGTVTVIKEVMNSQDPASNFTINASGNNPSSVSFTGSTGTVVTFGLGSYEITETPPANYSVATSTNCSGTIAGGESLTCTIINTYHSGTGTLIVKKVVNGGNANPSYFQFRVGDGGSRYFETDGQNDIPVPIGTYNITEITAVGYDASYNNCNKITVPEDGSATCTITNTYNGGGGSQTQTGTLIVKKVVINDNGKTSVTSDFSFQVNQGDPQAFEADGRNDLTENVGTYNITESAVSGYTTTYDNCTNVEITANGSATCTITNNDIASQGRSGPPPANGAGTPIGEVLGASTSTGEVLGESTCSPYMLKFVGYGHNNDTMEVSKLQMFLNEYLGASLPITGIFGNLTLAALNQFQVKEYVEVLRPWVPYGLSTETTPTGYSYKTTTRWINMIKCPALGLLMPELP